jgi:hypothetical protein
MNSQKTILLPILFGLTLRNFFRTNFLEKIKASGHRLVCLLPSLDVDDFVEEFQDDQVEFHLYPTYKPKFIERRLREIRDVQFENFHGIYALKKKKEELKKNHFKKYFFNHHLLAPFLPKGGKTFLDSLYWACHRTEGVLKLWEKIRPDLLISTNSFFWEELPFLKMASQKKIPVLGVVHSWDNLTTKYKLPFHFSKTAVWNAIMFQEIKKYYPDMLSDTVVTGVAQFDYYLEIEKKGKRKEDFLKDLGLDPTLPLVVYTTVPDRISKACHEDVNILLKAIQDNYFGQNLNVLVRLHQTGEKRRFDGISSRNNYVIEHPGRMNPLMKDLFNPTYGDMLHFADTLRHASCVINVASTVSIDAAVLGTPVVNVGADFLGLSDNDCFTRDCYNWEHFRPVVESGAVRVVKNINDYLKAIKEAIDFPMKTEEGRQRLRETLAAPLDGCSAERLADLALSLL